MSEKLKENSAWVARLLDHISISKVQKIQKEELERKAIKRERKRRITEEKEDKRTHFKQKYKH